MPTWSLYTITVIVWGFSWHAMLYQVGVAPELSIAYRFLMAAVIMAAFCAATRRRLTFRRRDYGLMALLGLFLFCTNYILFYYAAHYLATGLLAVVFSMITVLNMANAAILFGQKIEGRVAIAAAFGLLGLVLTFWSDIAGHALNHAVLVGLGLALLGTLSASLGNMASIGLGRRGIGVVESNTIGMSVGALASFAFAMLHGAPLAYNPAPSYTISLLFLALFATVFGFGAFLTLGRRIGAARAAYSSVLFPILALALSAWFENYRPAPEAILGVALILVGNVFALRRTPRPAPAPAQ
ncbi:MAG TPA: DMT family transporter [Dongiaceae bacterium]|jgi:drug/metabolite transporter (DMT)-like permease|nr:DMT family transporter [Dongiaceae bacterium]